MARSRADAQGRNASLNEYWGFHVNCDKWCWLRNVTDPDRFAKDRAELAKFVSLVSAPSTFEKTAGAGADIGKDKLKG
jgi:hypothetical protein